MSSKSVPCVAILIGWALAAPTVVAQNTTGSIRGYVRDSTGAPITEARVVAERAAVGFHTEVTTASSGFYVLSGLDPGEYTVTAYRIGMTSQRRATQLGVGETLIFNFLLTPAAMPLAAVVVVGTPPAIETQTSEVASNITPAQIDNLPLPDRNFLDLAALAPGTTILNTGLSGTQKTFATGAQSANNVNVFVDGISFKNDLTAGGVVGQDASRGNPFPLDAVQDFRIITSNYKAEYQTASSGIITATTRSGTNQWQGSVFAYGMGAGLIGQDSLPCGPGSTKTNCVAFPKPQYDRYQTGASFGGPLIRDHLFIYGAYEGNYQTTDTAVAFNQDSHIVPGAYPALDTVKLGQYQGQFSSPFRSSLFFGKLSYVPTASQTLDITANIRHETDVRDFGLATSYLTADDYRDDVDEVAAKHRYTHGDWVNEALLSYQHYERNPTPVNNDIVGRTYFDDVICCTTIATIGGAQSIQDFTQNRLSLRDDLTYSGWHWAGQHVVKVGAYVDVTAYDIDQDNDENPLFTYFASDSFAFPRQAVLGYGNPTFTTSNHELGAYIQDDWSPFSRLLLNIGVRWDYESEMLDNNYVTPTIVRDSLAGVVPSQYFTDGTQRPPFYGEIQPRLGFSLALDQDSRTTIFGGFGVYYDRDLYDDVAIQEQYSLQHPNYNFFFFENPVDSGAGKVRWQNSYLSRTGLLGLLASGQTGKPEVDLVSNETKPPYSEQWSLGARRLLGPVGVSLTYQNIQSYNGLTYTCGNLTGGVTATGQPTNCFAPPVPSTFGNVFLSSDAVQTWYEAVLFKIERPYTHSSHWGGGLAYTWAQGTQDGGDLFSFDYVSPTAYPHYPSPGVEKTTVVANWIVDVPFGFLFSGVLTLGSGYPYAYGGPEQVAFPTTQSFIFGNAWAFRDIDVRFQKFINTLSAQRVKVTAEVFNVFNFQNLGCWSGAPAPPPTATNPSPVSTQTPGCITYGSRRAQLGVGYDF